MKTIAPYLTEAPHRAVMAIRNKDPLPNKTKKYMQLKHNCNAEITRTQGAGHAVGALRYHVRPNCKLAEDNLQINPTCISTESDARTQ